MLSKSMDTAKQNAEGLARMMQAPAQAPLPAGSGNIIDVMA
jgi:hypothetical protein